MKKQRFMLGSPLAWKLAGVIGIVFLIGVSILTFFSLLGAKQFIEGQDGTLEAFEALRAQLMFMTLAVLFFMIAAVLTLIDLFLAPLKQIMEKVQIISRGNTEERITLNTGDEFQELAETLENMKEKFKEIIAREQGLSHLKSEFLALAAHQLRTPLSALKWAFHTLLEEDKLPKTTREMLKKASHANEKMIQLVNDLLDVIQIEEGRFDYSMQKQDITKVVHAAIKEREILVREKNIKVFFEIPEESIPRISFDREKFQIAFLNIFDNAIQYTPPQGEIHVKLESKQTFLLLSVRDTGVGIPQHEIPRLFTKFFRGSNALRMETEGSGLGLFITKNIIERHGGKIMVESKEGKGTTVSFILPFSEEYHSSQEQYQKFMKEL